MPKQLYFDLPVRASLERGDFFVSDANATAVAAIDRPEDWPNGRLCLVGPKGSGKSHLANVWHLSTEAPIVSASSLAERDIPHLGDAPAVILEDIHLLPRDSERLAFHLINLAMAAGHRLLMTSRAAPSQLNVVLPDLASRLQASGVAQLDEPDDTLFAQLLVKLFADRQVNPEPALIPWLVARLERSFETAESVVDQLDRAALSEGRNITRTLARQLLDI